MSIKSKTNAARDNRRAATFGTVLIVATLSCTLLQNVYAQTNLIGSNLIVNGNAEAGPAGTSTSNVVSSIPGWNKGTGAVNVLSYDIKGVLPSTAPAPPDHMFQYFVASGTGATATVTQTIDVSAAAATIASGTLRFTLSGYLGSSNGATIAPQASLAAAFQNAKGQTFSTVTLGPLGYNGNGLSLQQQIGLVPAGTVMVGLTLTLNTYCPNSSSCAWASADSLSLVFGTTGPSSLIGPNLVVNGNAESGPSGTHGVATAPYIPGWSTQDGASVAPYGGTNWIAVTNPSPVNAGVNLFCGGGNSAGIYQDIDVSAAASLIDANQVTYQISAWLGGTFGVTSPTLTYLFYDWTGKQLATNQQLGAVGHNFPGLVEASNSGNLPAGTRRVRISLSFSTFNAAADNIAFNLSAPNGPPVIDPGGIVNLSAFGGGTTLAQGSWIEIYGRNLATGTASWSGADFVNGIGPTLLQGVSVSVGGQPAFVNYVSPGQIDVLIPSNALTGVVPVTVTTSNGTSDPYSVLVNQTQPSLLAPTSFSISGKQYVAAFNPDGTFALPKNALVGVNSAPATHGDTIVFYGIGFGPVSDGVMAGTIPMQNDSLTLPLVISFGTTKAQLVYAGFASGLTGLYQINVVVPQLPVNGAEPVSFTLGGKAGGQTLYIAVQ